MGKGAEMKGRIEAVAFTDMGEALAETLMKEIGGSCSRSGRPDSLREWTAQHFCDAEGLVFVGAAGIAVRAIAPCVSDKTKDPAVVVVDESGRYVIPLLSGHLGGANDLARRLAVICGGEAVITTATDVRGVFAVDEWTKRQGCVIIEPEKIMEVSGGLLAGKTIAVRSPWDISGPVPRGCTLTEDEEADIALDIRISGKKPLHAVPVICTLGVGCRKGTKAGDLEEFFLRFMEGSGVDPHAIKGVATIDLKADEEGLLEFCNAHGWKLETYSAGELEKAEGDFSVSQFVSTITGVDNVCERSAVTGSKGGRIIRGKTAGNGITMALAAEEYRPDWRWKDE